MHTLNGGCHCGKLRVTANLTEAPGAYRPRECDCDFCRKHAAAYVSDPHGSLLVRISDESAVTRYRQGSGLAQMLLCSNCGVLVAAVYQDERELYGVVNARILDGWQDFGAAQVVSPRALSGDEKVSRWQGIWFSDVSIANLAG
jgi:hypothetical protein